MTKNNSRMRSIIREIFILFLVVIFAISLRTFLFELHSVPTGSMIRTLLIGDKVIINKYQYGFSGDSFLLKIPFIKGRFLEYKDPERGDIVVFGGPNDLRYVKRLIGLPGECIQVHHGQVFINDKPIKRVENGTYYDEDSHKLQHVFVETMDNGITYDTLQMNSENLDTSERYCVPAGHYFMMGDNRDNSADSRTERMGYISYDNLIGKAEMIFFSNPVPIWEIWNWFGGLRANRTFKYLYNHD